jgi:hypothetical protein
MVDQYEAVLPRAKKQLLDDRKFLAARSSRGTSTVVICVGCHGFPCYKLVYHFSLLTDTYQVDRIKDSSIYDMLDTGFS